MPRWYVVLNDGTKVPFEGDQSALDDHKDQVTKGCIWSSHKIEYPNSNKIECRSNKIISVEELNTKLHASSTVINQPISLANPSGYQDIGGVVSNPNFFIFDLSKALGRITGSYRSQGSGVLLKLIEVDSSGVEKDLNSSPYSLDDTAGQWKKFAFTTDIPPGSGSHVYILKGTLGNASSSDIRFTSTSLLELD